MPMAKTGEIRRSPRSPPLAVDSEAAVVTVIVQAGMAVRVEVREASLRVRLSRVETELQGKETAGAQACFPRAALPVAQAEAPVAPATMALFARARYQEEAGSRIRSQVRR